MEKPDILSRSTQDGLNFSIENYEERAIKLHKDLTHRKNIKRDLKKEGITISDKQLKEILRTCEKCAQGTIKLI